MKLLNEFGITNVTVTGDTRFDRVLDVRKQARELPFIKRFLESKEGKRPDRDGGRQFMASRRGDLYPLFP